MKLKLSLVRLKTFSMRFLVLKFLSTILMSWPGAFLLWRHEHTSGRYKNTRPLLYSMQGINTGRSGPNVSLIKKVLVMLEETNICMWSIPSGWVMLILNHLS